MKASLKFEATNPKDRKGIFQMCCDRLLLDSDKVAKELKIKSIPSGYSVNIDTLFAFFYKYKLQGTFDFGNKTVSVICEQLIAKPKSPITHPEDIPSTEADEKIELTPLDPDLMKKDDDTLPEDDNPF